MRSHAMALERVEISYELRGLGEDLLLSVNDLEAA